MTDIQLPTLPEIGKDQLFAEHDVWIAPTPENVQVFANEKGREIINKKFAGGQALWVYDARVGMPTGWQVTMLPDDPVGIKDLINWCTKNGCTLALSGGGTTATVPPYTDLGGTRLKR
jgi:hypothetical protein